MNVGALALDAGDTLNLSMLAGSGSSVSSITINGALGNAGTLNTGNTTSSSSAHSNGFTITVTGGAGGTFNTGTMNVRSLSGTRRSNTVFNLPGNNTNEGDLVVRNVSSQGGSTMLFKLTGGDVSNPLTFTNDGTISIEGAGRRRLKRRQLPVGGHRPEHVEHCPDIRRRGTLTLKSNLSSRTNSTAIISGTNSGLTGLSLTNASTHTIQGDGWIGHAGQNGTSGSNINISSFATITNDGLIKSFRGNTTNSLTGIEIRGATANITNSLIGRMVSASGLAADGLTPLPGSILRIGVSGATFTNEGLLEARSGNFITIDATNLTLNGNLRGGGTYTAANLAINSATLAPGDLTETNGTGTSTVGAMGVTGGLTLAEATTLDFQLGKAEFTGGAAGTTYDTINVTGPHVGWNAERDGADGLRARRLPPDELPHRRLGHSDR